MQRNAARQDNFMRFLAWVQVNQKRLILGGTIVVLIIAATAFAMYYQGQKEIRASLALSNVRVPVSPGAPVAPGTADAYLKVAKEHDGTKAGVRALLQGAATLFTDGRYAEAQKTFEQLLKEYPESEWVVSAHYGIAATLDAQGKTAEATAKFEEIRRRFATEPIGDEVKLALGRLYENQNKPDEAHKLYADVLQNNPAMYSATGSEAAVRKSELEEKFPHLAQTNAPILSPPPLTSLTNRPAPTGTNRLITLSNILTAPTTGGVPANVPLQP